MTMAMLSALAATDANVYRRGAVAWAYFRWILSDSVDVGNTIKTSVSEIDTLGSSANDRTVGHNMSLVAAAYNGTSLANGSLMTSLMRATPIGVWAHQLVDTDIAFIAGLDSGITHPHDLCKASVAAYSIAIASLVNSGTRHERVGPRSGQSTRRGRAFNDALTWAQAESIELNPAQAAARKTVAEWLESARKGHRPRYHPQIGIGYIHIGFVEAFRHLHAETPFFNQSRKRSKAAVTQTLTPQSLGGCLALRVVVEICHRTC